MFIFFFFMIEIHLLQGVSTRSYIIMTSIIICCRASHHCVSDGLFTSLFALAAGIVYNNTTKFKITPKTGKATLNYSI